MPAALLEDIRDRLREPCAHLAPDAFAALVLAIARTKLRWQRRAANIPGMSGLWEPPASPALPAGPRSHGTEREAE
jgi:hypothetical protein